MALRPRAITPAGEVENDLGQDLGPALLSRPGGRFYHLAQSRVHVDRLADALDVAAAMHGCYSFMEEVIAVRCQDVEAQD